MSCISFQRSVQMFTQDVRSSRFQASAFLKQWAFRKDQQQCLWQKMLRLPELWVEISCLTRYLFYFFGLQTEIKCITKYHLFKQPSFFLSLGIINQWVAIALPEKVAIRIQQAETIHHWDLCLWFQSIRFFTPCSMKLYSLMHPINFDLDSDLYSHFGE